MLFTINNEALARAIQLNGLTMYYHEMIATRSYREEVDQVSKILDLLLCKWYPTVRDTFESDFHWNITEKIRELSNYDDVIVGERCTIIELLEERV
jgi:hypothetical protein